MRRGAVCPKQRHYLCRWALGIRTRDSLSMLARPVHNVLPQAQINRSQPSVLYNFFHAEQPPLEIIRIYIIYIYVYIYLKKYIYLCMYT